MSEVTAKYLGYDKRTDTYRVNVKNAHPTGKIGDAGVIKYFEAKDKAKEYTDIVNKTKQDVFVPLPKKLTKGPLVRHEGDVFTQTQTFKGNEDKKVKVEPCAKISLWRGVFSKLTDEQINAVNETGELPKGTKFQPSVNGYVICHNWFGLMPGTQIMPAGYELKKNIFGFTVCVPKGTEGLFIKSTK